MGTTGISRRRIENLLILGAGGDRFGECVVVLEDHSLGSILAVGGLVLATRDREGVHDEVDVTVRKCIHWVHHDGLDPATTAVTKNIVHDRNNVRKVLAQAGTVATTKLPP